MPQIQVKNNYFLIQSEGAVSSYVYIFIASKDNSFIKYAYISEGYGDIDSGESLLVQNVIFIFLKYMTFKN